MPKKFTPKMYARCHQASDFRVAAMILAELTQAKLVGVDESREWSEQDIRDLTAFSLSHAATLYPKEVDYV